MKKHIFLLITLVAASNLYAKDITFTAYAPDIVVVGDRFNLAYTVTTQKVKDFRAPASITGFDILSGPYLSQQSSTQIASNGSATSTSSITYTYTLLANKEGDFSIPAATIIADGEQMISNAVKIKVLPADKLSANSTGRPNNNPNQSSSASSGATISSQDLFVTATATRTKVFEQEAFLLTYKIYTLVDMTLANVKWPDFKGFHSQEVELQSSWKQEHYNGRNYRTAVYRQFVLFPQHEGRLTIEPAHLDVIIVKPIRYNDPFDDYFNGGSNSVKIKKTITSPKLTINVDPLPSGKPAGFSGGVGDFSISSSINTEEIKANDAITIKVVISGTGNLKLISNPEIVFPKDFETFDPKIDNKTRLTQNGLIGSRVIEYLAIPRHAGKFKIPAVAFSYFDVKSKSYKKLTTQEYEINVQKGDGNAEQVIANFTNKEELKVLGEDIRFIKLNKVNLTPKGQFFYGSVSYWLFYIIPGIAFIIFFIVYRKQAVESRNIAKVRTKKANKVAVKRLKLAGKLLSENEKDAFYDEVLKTLWGYISDKLNIPVSKLSKDNIEEKLTDYGVDNDLIKNFIDALNECEFARFAPGDENQAMDKVYATALDVISKMENSIKH
ncbi:MAG: BatD family protein [Tannerellaceae bacterium]|jgi:hypothetical protein|nr:BatD family protein [Tannerellaceae bacterium]